MSVRQGVEFGLRGEEYVFQELLNLQYLWRVERKDIRLEPSPPNIQKSYNGQGNIRTCLDKLHEWGE